MGKIVTLKGLLKQWLQSTLAAFAFAFLIHIIKLQLQTPDQEPDADTCHQLTSLESSGGLDSFSKFYSFYLCEHSHKYTKLLHFVGTLNASVMVSKFVRFGWNPKFLVFGIVQGYAFAWVSHFFVEQNKPAAFKYPAYSFFSDWVLLKDLTFGTYRMW